MKEFTNVDVVVTVIIDTSFVSRGKAPVVTPIVRAVGDLVRRTVPGPVNDFVAGAVSHSVNAVVLRHVNWPIHREFDRSSGRLVAWSPIVGECRHWDGHHEGGDDHPGSNSIPGVHTISLVEHTGRDAGGA